MSVAFPTSGTAPLEDNLLAGPATIGPIQLDANGNAVGGSVSRPPLSQRDKTKASPLNSSSPLTAAPSLRRSGRVQSRKSSKDSTATSQSMKKRTRKALSSINEPQESSTSLTHSNSQPLVASKRSRTASAAATLSALNEQSVLRGSIRSPPSPFESNASNGSNGPIESSTSNRSNESNGTIESNASSHPSGSNALDQLLAARPASDRLNMSAPLSPNARSPDDERENISNILLNPSEVDFDQDNPDPLASIPWGRRRRRSNVKRPRSGPNLKLPNHVRNEIDLLFFSEKKSESDIAVILNDRHREFEGIIAKAHVANVIRYIREHGRAEINPCNSRAVSYTVEHAEYVCNVQLDHPTATYEQLRLAAQLRFGAALKFSDWTIHRMLMEHEPAFSTKRIYLEPFGWNDEATIIQRQVWCGRLLRCSVSITSS
jgi:hypothetical protein